MKTKHTKGEWTRNAMLTKSGEKIIAIIDPVYGDMSEESLANAKLITTAPELLSALNEVCRLLKETELYKKPTFETVYEDSIAALKKATE